MGRSWEYTRWRRVLMQAVLCASLGVTVALAWWVVSVHAAALRVKLKTPQTFANLVLNTDVRLPEGWKIEAYSKENRAQIDLTESKPRYGSSRVIGIFLERVPEDEPLPTAEQALADDMGNRPGLASNLEFMGQPGILKAYPTEMIDASVGKSLRAVLCAYTVVPGLKPTLVKVRMTGPFTFAPADVEVLKNVAQSLQASDPLHPAPELSVPVFKLGEIRPAPAESGQNTNN